MLFFINTAEGSEAGSGVCAHAEKSINAGHFSWNLAFHHSNGDSKENAGKEGFDSTVGTGIHGWKKKKVVGNFWKSD